MRRRGLVSEPVGLLSCLKCWKGLEVKKEEVEKQKKEGRGKGDLLVCSLSEMYTVKLVFLSLLLLEV